MKNKWHGQPFSWPCIHYISKSFHQQKAEANHLSLKAVYPEVWVLSEKTSSFLHLCRTSGGCQCPTADNHYWSCDVLIRIFLVGHAIGLFEESVKQHYATAEINRVLHTWTAHKHQQHNTGPKFGWCFSGWPITSRLCPRDKVKKLRLLTPAPPPPGLASPSFRQRSPSLPQPIPSLCGQPQAWWCWQAPQWTEEHSNR